MGTSWPTKRRLIGGKTTRIDGPAKSTGRAKYSYDVNRPGMLHAVMLRSPYAHALVKNIDTSKAEKMPGVKAIHIIPTPVNDKPRELFFAGDEILALAADTEEHALDAVREIVVDYEQLDHIVTEEDALKNPKKKTTPGQGDSNIPPLPK